MTPAQQKKFDLEFPKSQLFSKTELAKFEFSATNRPHVVSRGAQKNFAEFAKEIGDAWATSEAKFDELWYRRLISKAIIFRKLEAEVPKQAWYEGGYRASIVTYAMAKVFHDANTEREVLDLDTIARRQALSDPLVRALLVAATAAHDVITHPAAGMRNMSEWAKQQACWNGLARRELDYGSDFESCLTLKHTAKSNERDERKRKRVTDGISAQAEVVTLGGSFWGEVLSKGTEHRQLSPKDEQILRVCASIPRQFLVNSSASMRSMFLSDSESRVVFDRGTALVPAMRFHRFRDKSSNGYLKRGLISDGPYPVTAQTSKTTDDRSRWLQ